MNKSKYVVPTLIVQALASTALYAEDKPSGFVLEEVTVTARKREESLQDTPVAVSAFTANELKLRQIGSTQQLGDVTPNLTFDAYAPGSGSNSSSQIFIRGIGQTDFTAVTDPGVGLYVDGVYYARSIGGATDFLDLERIEVLRGPQGTLFGRNTIGGAIALHTRRPAEEFGGDVELEIGDDSKRNVAVNVDIPLSDTLLSKVSLASRDRDGFVKRIHDGVELGDDDALSGRVALQWTPSNELELFMTADYTKERESGAPAVSLGLNDQATFVYLTNSFNPDCPIAFPPLAGPGSGRDTANNPACVNETAFIGEFTNGGTGQVASELDYWGVSLEATWDVNDWLIVKSITAYRDMDSFSARDGDHTPFTIFHTQDPFEQDQFSQEFQFSGTALDNRVNWLVGLYYFEEQADNPNPVQFPPMAVGQFVSGGKTDNKNFALFSQVSWDVTDQWSLTAGLRYTDETKRFSPYSFIPEGGFYVKGGPGSPGVRFFDCPTGNEPGCTAAGRLFTAGDRLLPAGWFEEAFDDWTPMLNVAYHASEDVMVYFTYSEGFKSGGFDQRYNVEFLAGPTSFDPETATTYELGMKSAWLNNTLRLNLAAFFTDYEDMHIIVREGFAPITFNAGESEIQGFEIETTFVPNESWLIQFGAGYIDADYTKLSEKVLTGSPIRENFSLAQTPDWSTNLGVAYTFNVGDLGTVTPRIDWSYRSGAYQDAINTERLFQGSYHLLNASVSFLSTDEVWEVVLAGRNLNDELYQVAGISAFDTGPGFSAGTFARESEWSLSAKYHF